MTGVPDLGKLHETMGEALLVVFCIETVDHIIHALCWERIQRRLLNVSGILEFTGV